MRKKKVSAIVPIYNQEKYITDALISLSIQTFTDFEVIIVNDGCTDKSMDLVLKYQQEHPELDLKIVCHETNEGISKARNSGIKNATGKYVSFLSADDVWDKNFLLEMVKIINQYKSDLIFCHTNILDKNGCKRERQPPFQFTVPTTFNLGLFHSRVLNSARNQGMFVNYSAILGKKEWFEGEYSFWEGVKYGEDLYHLIFISDKAYFTYLPTALVSYREHEESTTFKKANEIHNNNKLIFEELKKRGVFV